MAESAKQINDQTRLTAHGSPLTALFISPHLDDAAFSCGATMIELARCGWRTILCTVFTGSVLHPRGFALACQTDKGLTSDVDYMRLRRAEDAEFARIANVSQVVNLDLREAPHRGYESAPELFAGIKTGDEIWREVAVKLQTVYHEFAPTLIFAPSGFGNHVDHLQTIRAVLHNNFAHEIRWYRDTPYVIRNREAAFSDLLPRDLCEQAFAISPHALETKIAGCCAYATQIEFQFGGAARLAETLREFHGREAARFRVDGLSENFFSTTA